MLDISTLKVVVSTQEPRVLQVLTPTSEVLWQANLEDVVSRLGPDAATRPGAVVLEALDSVLANATLLREDATGELRLHSVALLNPFTNEIAVRALPKTLAFPSPVACATPGPGGVLAALDGTELVVAGERVAPREMERRYLSSNAAAHAV